MLRTLQLYDDFLQDAYATSPKAFHIIGMPGFMKKVYDLFSVFIKDKIKERFQFHAAGDLKKLQEDCGLEVLPAELGGTNGTIEDHIGEEYLKKTFV